MTEIYLDHAATTAVRPEVLAAMWPFFAEAYANPSSAYDRAGGPRAALEQAHSVLAGVLGCRPGEVVFTGSGTEADNLAVLGVARARRSFGNHIITTQIEHEGVLRACNQLEREGFRLTYLPVDSAGLIDLGALGAALDGETILVSVMLANNEIGTIQPIAEISRLVRVVGVPLHTDAVQGAGMLDLDVNRLGVDLLTLSAHKCYGPKGMGALYVRRGTPLQPVIHGGGQERGRRSGTENVPGAVGMAVALSIAERERSTEVPRLIALRDRLIRGILATVPGAHLTGDPRLRLPGHASFYFDDLTGESILVNLDRDGVSCSSGSACKAGSTDPSHVLMGLGLSPAQARNGLRLTLGMDNTEEDVEYVLEVLPAIISQMRLALAPA